MLADSAQSGISLVNFDRFLYLKLPPGLTVEGVIARLEGHSEVEYVEPDFVGTGGEIIPNDPFFSAQWHHKNPDKPAADIHTPLAWEITRGSSNIIVAVLDTGLNDINVDEFELRRRPGHNFAYDNSDTTDDNGHGTAVTGVLAATGNNANRIAGVDWRCRVLPIKVLDASNTGSYSWWAQGIDFAVALGAKVINLSAGGLNSDITLTRSISNAIAGGVIFVTITHHDGSSIRFPGSLFESITLGATSPNDTRAGFSNYGPAIDLVAPGVNIETLFLGGTVGYWNGTSFAAAQASGTCALLLSIQPDLNQQRARTLLARGADDSVGNLAEDTPGFDIYYGWGRLNAYNSLLLLQSRIGSIRRLSNSTVEISWTSPPNASNQQPHRVEFSTSVTGPWIQLPYDNQFRYEPSRTYWTDTGVSTGTNFNSTTKFYRLRLRSD